MNRKFLKKPMRWVYWTLIFQLAIDSWTNLSSPETHFKIFPSNSIQSTSVIITRARSFAWGSVCQCAGQPTAYASREVRRSDINKGGGWLENYHSLWIDSKMAPLANFNIDTILGLAPPSPSSTCSSPRSDRSSEPELGKSSEVQYS